eukprot:6678515-Prorocentrum_lima.AAC.1
MLGSTLEQERGVQRNDAMQAAAAVLWDYQTAWSESRQRTLAAWLVRRAQWNVDHGARHAQWSLAVTLWLLEALGIQ